MAAHPCQWEYRDTVAERVLEWLKERPLGNAHVLRLNAPCEDCAKAGVIRALSMSPAPMTHHAWHCTLFNRLITKALEGLACANTFIDTENSWSVIPALAENQDWRFRPFGESAPARCEAYLTTSILVDTEMIWIQSGCMHWTICVQNHHDIQGDIRGLVATKMIIGPQPANAAVKPPAQAEKPALAVKARAQQEAEVPEGAGCCVCFETPELPWQLCPACGQMMCRPCHQRLPRPRQCPLCRQPAVELTTARFAMDMLQKLGAMPVVACGHKGCDARVPLNTLAAHRATCAKRPLLCFFSHCTWRGLLGADLEKHLLLEHAVYDGLPEDGIEITAAPVLVIVDHCLLHALTWSNLNSTFGGHRNSGIVEMRALTPVDTSSVWHVTQRHTDDINETVLLRAMEPGAEDGRISYEIDSYPAMHVIAPGTRLLRVARIPAIAGEKKRPRSPGGAEEGEEKPLSKEQRRD